MTKSAGEWEKTRLDLWKIYIHFLCAAVVGLAFFPMVYLLVGAWRATGAWPLWGRALAFSFSIGFGYLLFGVTLLFLAAFTVRAHRFRIAPGLYSIYSWGALNWLAYNAMIVIVNGAFLDVLRLSPFQALFYRWMGAKVGRNVNINTGGLADLSMLEIGDDVIIGGGVALICHASERGFMRLAPTQIGSNVSIGISSIIFPGCTIGDGAVIAPCSLLPRGTKVPPRGYWGGNPARDLRQERHAPVTGDA